MKKRFARCGHLRDTGTGACAAVGIRPPGAAGNGRMVERRPVFARWITTIRIFQRTLPSQRFDLVVVAACELSDRSDQGRACAGDWCSHMT